AEAWAGYDLQAIRRAGEAIRSHTIVNLPDYLERFASAASERGIDVFFAADGAEAVDYIRDVVRRRDARLIAKGKSMISEEIELNPALEADGVEVVETDLGEYIVQIAHEPPSHILAPAVHRSSRDIAELFNRVHG